MKMWWGGLGGRWASGSSPQGIQTEENRTQSPYILTSKSQESSDIFNG